MFYKLIYTPSQNLSKFDQMINTKNQRTLETMDRIHVIFTGRNQDALEFLVTVLGVKPLQQDLLQFIRRLVQHTLSIKDWTIPFEEFKLDPISVEEAVSQLDKARAYYTNNDVLTNLMAQFSRLSFKKTAHQHARYELKALAQTAEFVNMAQVVQSRKPLWINSKAGDFKEEYLDAFIQRYNAFIGIEGSSHFEERIGHFTELNQTELFFSETFMNSIRGYLLLVDISLPYPGTQGDRYVRETLLPQLLRLSSIAKVILLTDNDDSLAKQLNPQEVDFLTLDNNYRRYKMG